MSAPTIQKFDLSKRKVDKLIEDVNDFAISFDGEKVLYRKGDTWATASSDDGGGAPGGAGAPPKPGFGPLKLDGWEVYVEPRAMWNTLQGLTMYGVPIFGLPYQRARRASRTARASA